MRNEIITLNCGRRDNEYVSTVIRHASSELLPLINEKQKKIIVSIDVEAEIGELTCPEFKLDAEAIELLNKKLAGYVENEVRQVLNKAQKKWQADIFGFGKAIYREYPLEWNKMVPTWRDGGLKNLDVDIKVDANISRFGLRKNPIRPSESR